MKKNEKHFSFRIDADLLKQFEYISKYYDRSMNWMLLSLIRKCVVDFEAEHGRINDDEE